MTEPSEHPDWMEVWRRRAKDSCQAFKHERAEPKNHAVAIMPALTHVVA